MLHHWCKHWHHMIPKVSPMASLHFLGQVNHQHHVIVMYMTIIKYASQMPQISLTWQLVHDFYVSIYCLPWTYCKHLRGMHTNREVIVIKNVVYNISFVVIWCHWHQMRPMTLSIAYGTDTGNGIKTSTNGHIMHLNNHVNMSNEMVSSVAPSASCYCHVHDNNKICLSNATYKPHMTISSWPLCQYICLPWTYCKHLRGMHTNKKSL